VNVGSKLFLFGELYAGLDQLAHLVIGLIVFG
jgi:hypothetical protein